MGLLNRIFGGKKNLAKEISLDEEKIKQIWADCFASFQKKKEILKNFITPDGKSVNIEGVISLEKLISEELVDVNAVDKTKKEILDDLNRLASNSEWERLHDWRDELGESNVESQVSKFLKKLKEVLETEFQVIQLMKKGSADAQEALAWKMRTLIQDTEDMILIALSNLESRYAKRINAALMKILRGGTPAKKKPELSPENIKPSAASITLARDMAEQWPGPPLLPDVINDDEALAKIILDNNPELSAKKVKEVIIALRYNLYEPEDLE